MHQKNGGMHPCVDGSVVQIWRADTQMIRSGLEGFRCAAAGWLGVLLVAINTGAAHADNKKTIGWIERVSITTEDLYMDAKVDTGADSSSVHAEEIRYFMRDSAQWVEFTLLDRNNNAHTLRRPLKRMVKIKKKTQGYQRRPVVVLEICVGDARHPAQVNLAQRGHFKYPLLLGRSFLKSRFIVDPGSKHLLEPRCQTGRPTE